MKKFIVLVCMAAVIAAAVSVSDSLFASGLDCECFNDSAALQACYDWCQFYRGEICDDVLPFNCQCVSQYSGGQCGCFYWAVCSDMTYVKLYLVTNNCDMCDV